jgi:hypothetical protein
MNTSILSMDSAMYEFEKAQKSVQDEVKKMNAALNKQLSIQKNLLQVELMSLKVAQAAGNLSIEEAIQRATLIAQFREGIEKLEADIENNTEQGLKLGAEKGWEAFQKMREKQVQDLANSMSEAITDGLMSGDYKSIGKNILRILQQELLRKTLVTKITGVLDGIIGGISNAIFGGGGGSGLLGMASNGMSLYNTYQNAPGWFNTATNWLDLAVATQQQGYLQPQQPEVSGAAVPLLVQVSGCPLVDRVSVWQLLQQVSGHRGLLAYCRVQAQQALVDLWPV